MYCTVGMCTTVQKSPLLIFLLQKKHCSGPKLVLVSKSPPQKAMPARLKDNSIGMQNRRWSHVASVSPVQMAPESHKPKQEDKRIYITALPLAHAYQAPHTHTHSFCVSLAYRASEIQQRKSVSKQRASRFHQSGLSVHPLWPCADRWQRTETVTSISSVGSV